MAEQWYIQNFSSSPIALTIAFSWTVTPPQGSPTKASDTESYVVPAHQTLPAALILNPTFPDFQVVVANFV